MIATATAALFAAAWKGTLLAALALAVHRFARNRVPSAWMGALFLVALLRLLLPVAPATPFSVFNLVPASSPQLAPAVIIDGGAAMKTPAPVAVRTIPPPPGTPWWLVTLFGVWAAGALFFFGRAIVRSIAFHRQLSGSRDVDLSPLIDECRSLLHVRRRVRVATTDAVATPSLHGWLRPTLLLPSDFLHTFSREQLRYVVLHELAHLRRSDVLVNWIATAAQALHWFNPVVRLAVARLAEECELACDAMALDALRAEERPAYGGTVLEIVERLRIAQPVPALVGMTATPQQLKRRILMIATFRQSSRFSILFAALVLLVGMVTLTDASAGEVRVMRHHMAADLSPAAQEQIAKLDQRMSADLASATVQDVVNAVSNGTGVTFTIAPDALSDETQKVRFNLKATDVPAHLVLMETLHSAGLGLKFSDTGAEVVSMPQHEHMKMMLPHGGDEEQVIVMRHAGDKNELPVPPAPPLLREAGPGSRQVQVQATAEEHDGVTKKKLTVNINDGKPAGTLEIEVLK